MARRVTQELGEVAFQSTLRRVTQEIGEVALQSTLRRVTQMLGEAALLVSSLPLSENFTGTNGTPWSTDNWITSAASGGGSDGQDNEPRPRVLGYVVAVGRVGAEP